MSDHGPVARSAHVEVARTARYWAVGTAGARDVWVVLHGYGQLAEYFVRHFAPFGGGDRLIVAPEALSRFYLGSGEGGGHGTRVGATWMTREDRLADIADYVRYLDRALDAAADGFDAARRRLHVLGFSQGAVTAARWLHARHVRGLAPAARLVLWGGEVAPDVDLASPHGLFQETPLTLVVGDADRFATPAMLTAQRARLDAAAVRYDVVPFAGGHTLDRDTLRALLDRA